MSTLVGRRVSCPKCLASEAFSMRFDKKQRPYMTCCACNLRIFSQHWQPEAPYRLMALGMLVGTHQGRAVVIELMRELGWAAAPQTVEAPAAAATEETESQEGAA